MLQKIKRVDALARYPKFPVTDIEKNAWYFPEVYASYRLTVASDKGPTMAKDIAANLTLLVANMSYDSLLFMSDLKFPLYRKPSALPSDIKAVSYLQANNIGPRFTGAIKVELPLLKEFTRNLYWMVRTNTASGAIHFLDEEQNILGSIHYHGEVLLASLTRETHVKLLSAFKKTAFNTELVNHPWHYPPP
ncbi:MAG: hypothetical protein V4717_09390 [Bacteroidota bacterium]